MYILLEVNEIDLAQIAQLVEQRTENPRVAGSIPALGILLYGILAQLVEHLTFNQGVPGSNPGCLIYLDLMLRSFFLYQFIVIYSDSQLHL